MIRATVIAVVTAAVCMLGFSPAQAKPKRYHHINAQQVKVVPIDVAARPAYETQETRHYPAPMGRRLIAPSNGWSMAEGVIGSRPSGCPHAYCGCGARLYLGLSDVRLNLAWNWTKYYHGSTPVAVWRHHIAIIERMTGPQTAVLRDYNSGRGLSRIHERSIRGARIVGSVHYASNP
jgi:hypothetical protein